LRGHKGGLYEGGIRTPTLANWPRRLKPGEVAPPLHVTDWMPTLCALAGYKPPKDLKWDGHDIWPVLSGQITQPEPRTLYWLGPGRRSQAVRHGDWKLIVTKDGKEELFNLASDLGESNNVAARHPEVVSDLKKRLAEEAARDDDAVVKEKAAP